MGAALSDILTRVLRLCVSSLHSLARAVFREARKHSQLIPACHDDWFALFISPSPLHLTFSAAEDGIWMRSVSGGWSRHDWRLATGQRETERPPGDNREHRAREHLSSSSISAPVHHSQNSFFTKKYLILSFLKGFSVSCFVLIFGLSLPENVKMQNFWKS